MTKRILTLCALFALLALFHSAALAQAELRVGPQDGIRYGLSQFRWEGVVDGTSYVRFTRNRVFVETSSGLPVQRQRYDYSDPLPRAAVRLELNVFDGRGRVQLAEEPRAWNNYTAVVRIDDRSGGRDFYRFELRWTDQTRDDDYRDPQRQDNVSWSGRVDGEVVLHIRRGQVEVENYSGQGVWGDRYRFSAPLPVAPLNVNLVNARGRGEIVVIEQPSRRNGFMACVRISDRQSGASDYSFVLTWERPRYRTIDDRPRDGGGRRYDDDDDDGRGNGRRGLHWTGRVDGRDVLFVKGNRVWFDHQTGAPICEDNARFYSTLPPRDCDLTVRKLRGRGQVVVLERPSAYNDYTAKILLDDRDGGADQYELEVLWQ